MIEWSGVALSISTQVFSFLECCTTFGRFVCIFIVIINVTISIRHCSVFEGLRRCTVSPSARSAVCAVCAVCKSIGIFDHYCPSLKRVIESNFIWFLIRFMHVTYSVVHPIIHCQFYFFSNLFYSLNEFAGTIPQFCNFSLFYSSIMYNLCIVFCCIVDKILNIICFVFTWLYLSLLLDVLVFFLWSLT